MAGPILVLSLAGCLVLLPASLGGAAVWRAGWRRGRRRLLVRVGLAPGRWGWGVTLVAAVLLGAVGATWPGLEPGGWNTFSLVAGCCLVLVGLPAWQWAGRARQALEDVAPALLDMPTSEALRRVHRPETPLPEQLRRPFYAGSPERPHLETLHGHQEAIAAVAHRRPYQRWHVRQGRADRAALVLLGSLVTLFSLSRLAARLDWTATGGHPVLPTGHVVRVVLVGFLAICAVLLPWAIWRRDRQRSTLPAKALELPLQAVLPEVRQTGPVALGSGDPMPVEAFALGVGALAALAPDTRYWQELRDVRRRPAECAGYRIGGMTALTGTVVRCRTDRSATVPARLPLAAVALRGPLVGGGAVAVVPHGTSTRRWRQWNLESASFEDRFDLLATDRALGNGVLPARSAEAVLCLPEGCGVVVAGSVVLVLGLRPLPPAARPVLLSTALVVAALIPEHLLALPQRHPAR